MKKIFLNTNYVITNSPIIKTDKDRNSDKKSPKKFYNPSRNSKNNINKSNDLIFLDLTKNSEISQENLKQNNGKYSLSPRKTFNIHLPYLKSFPNLRLENDNSSFITNFPDLRSTKTFISSFKNNNSFKTSDECFHKLEENVSNLSKIDSKKFEFSIEAKLTPNEKNIRNNLIKKFETNSFQFEQKKFILLSDKLQRKIVLDKNEAIYYKMKTEGTKFEIIVNVLKINGLFQIFLSKNIKTIEFKTIINDQGNYNVI